MRRGRTVPARLPCSTPAPWDVTGRLRIRGRPVLHITRPRRRGVRSAAFRESTHVALGTALDERELRTAVGATLDEGLLRAAGTECGEALWPRHGLTHRRERAGARDAAQEILLDALLFLHPLLDRHADGLRHRAHLLRSHGHGP